MTLFGASDSRQSNGGIQTLIVGIWETIRISMDNGDYNHVDDRIIKMTFVNETEIDDRPNQPTNIVLVDPGGSDVPVYGWVLIVVGSVLLLAVLCACPCDRTDDDDGDGGERHDAHETPHHRESLLVHLPPDEDYDEFDIPGESTGGGGVATSTRSGNRPGGMDVPGTSVDDSY
mmetsp:Transcript_12700/g.29524  ORF Transcript_12700/g.29524 Transcript_12700/m.29524 type:complete len:174 (-) Transcript_12700:423-944(-)